MGIVRVTTPGVDQLARTRYAFHWPFCVVPAFFRNNPPGAFTVGFDAPAQYGPALLVNQPVAAANKCCEFLISRVGVDNYTSDGSQAVLRAGGWFALFSGGGASNTQIGGIQWGTPDANAPFPDPAAQPFIRFVWNYGQSRYEVHASPGDGQNTQIVPIPAPSVYGGLINQGGYLEMEIYDFPGAKSVICRIEGKHMATLDLNAMFGDFNLSSPGQGSHLGFFLASGSSAAGAIGGRFSTFNLQFLTMGAP